MSRPFLFREIRREQIACDLLGKDAVFSVLQYRRDRDLRLVIGRKADKRSVVGSRVLGGSRLSRDRDREIPEHAIGGSPGILRDCQHRLPDLVQIVL